MNRRHAAGLLAAAPLLGTRIARAEATLKIAALAVDASALALYADAMGFFKGDGITLDIRRIGGGAIPPAVASGALDIGWSNMVSLATAYKRGLPFTVIAAGGIYERGKPTSGLFVGAASPIQSAKDLNGKTIAVDALTNLGQFGTKLWIDQNGGDSESVRWLEMEFPQMPAALDDGRVAAAFYGEPFIQLSKAKTRMLGAPLDLVAPRLMIGAWFTTTAWVRQHPELLKSFQTTIARTAGWANDHREQTATILAEYSRANPEVVKSMRRIGYGTRPEVAEIQPIIDLAAKYKAIPASFPAREILTA